MRTHPIVSAVVTCVCLGAALGAASSCGAKPAATPAPVASFPGSASLERARAAAAANQLDRAADALADAMREIEDAGPLRIRNMQLVERDVRGFGLYTGLRTDTLKPGDGLFLYFEPAGMTHVLADGLWTSDLTADLAILLPDGTVAQDKPDFLVSTVQSHAPNREIQFVMRLATTGIQEGDFLVRVTLHDRLGKKTAVEQIPVKFRLK